MGCSAYGQNFGHLSRNIEEEREDFQPLHDASYSWYSRRMMMMYHLVKGDHHLKSTLFRVNFKVIYMYMVRVIVMNWLCTRNLGRLNKAFFCNFCQFILAYFMIFFNWDIPLKDNLYSEKNHQILCQKFGKNMKKGGIV